MASTLSDSPPMLDRPGTPIVPPPLSWTARKVAVIGLACALVGGILGFRIGEPDRPGAASVDVGFLQDMIDHHDQAVYMGKLAMGDVPAPVDTFAREVVQTQQWETGRMDAWLQDWGYARGDPERSNAMAWMGHATPAPSMPGMASDVDLERLEAADGTEAGVLFLQLMREHHLGGAEMAEYAAEHASRAKVRELADLMARNQRSEVREYDLVLRSMGAPEPPTPPASSDAGTQDAVAGHAEHGG